MIKIGNAEDDFKIIRFIVLLHYAYCTNFLAQNVKNLQY